MNRKTAVCIVAMALCAVLGDAGRAAPSAGGAVRVGPASAAGDDLAGRGYAAEDELSFSDEVSQSVGTGDHAVLVGRWDGGRGHARAVAVSGNVVYFSAGRNLKILDVSNPAAPVLLSRLELPGEIWDITVVGSHAYLATPSGLRVLDVSNPAAPAVVGATSDPASTVAVSGSRAYLTGGGYPFRIVDISNPAAPVEISSSPALFSGLHGLAVAGEFAYTVDGDRLRIVDVSDPLSPVEVGSYLAYQAYGVEVAGSLAYVVTSPALLVLDVSNPAAPTLVSRFTRSSGFGGQADLDVTLSGGYLYVANPTTTCCIGADEGLLILDVSNPAAPAEVGLFKVSFSVGVAVSGSHAFLAVDDAGLVIVDVSDPAAPTQAGSFGTRAGLASRVVVSGSSVYVGDATGPARFNPLYAELNILDASNPGQPTKVGSYRLPKAPGRGFPNTWSFAVSGAYAYVATDTDGLRIVDVSDPAAPAEVGILDTPGRALGVAVSGSLAYVADYTGGLRIADVSDPTAPVEIGSLDTPFQDRYSEVEVHGRNAFVLDTNFVLHIVDVTDPAHPAFETSVEGGYGFAVAGSLLYVARSYYGLQILDVSDPGAVVEVALVEMIPNGATDVAVAGSVAYVTGFERGLVLLDVSNPSAPREIGSYPVPDAWAVTVEGDYVYVAAGQNGLYVIARDSDGDGIGNPTDACLASIRTPTVGFGTCDSGIDNMLFADGCTMADRFAACDAGAIHHIRNMSCVTSVIRQLRVEGVISAHEEGDIHRCAALPSPRDLVTTVTPGARVPELIRAMQPYASVSEGSWAYATALVVDHSGNVITVGTFGGTVDFDPGPGSYNLTGGGTFIAKLDADQGFVWAKQIASTEEGSLYPVSVAVDGAGGVHVGGNVSGVVDFDPGPDTSILDNGANYSAFVVKLHAEGSFAWARRTGGLFFDWFSGPAITLDRFGNVYATGSFFGTEDFDPGPGTYNLAADTADVFVSKLDRDGHFVWARSLHSVPDPSGNNGIYGGTIAVDEAGNVHTVGGFYGPVDFDPGAGEHIVTPSAYSGYGMFVSKLDAAGDFVWARSVGTGTPEAYDLALDGAGNVYTSGPFYGTVDLDPGPGRYSLTESDGTRFVAKFDATGGFGWATTDPTYGPGNLADIAVDGGGNVYSIGSIDAYDLDRTFCRKRDTHGKVVWTAGMGGSGHPYPERIALGPGGTVHVLGHLYGSADFDPGPGVFEMTSDDNAQYLLKLGPPDSDDDGIPDEGDACPDSIMTPTVVLGGCDSEVPNTLLPDGCTITDRIAECDGADSQGQQSGCVASVVNGLRNEGVISGNQSSAIRQCASQPPPRL